MFRKLLVVMMLLPLVALVFAQQHRVVLNPNLRPFYHGVESGDPTDNGVIIWTRVTPDTGVTGDIEVYWQIATDTGFTNVVNYGKVNATEANHYCAKVDVCGLQPARFYYYMFRAFGRNSIVGRTKTAPAATADNDSVRFAVVSCASWEHGYFNAYKSIVEKNDVDAVVHLGDYIYEYETGDFSGNVSGRTYDPPTECTTEIGYELRYSQYKLDDQLRRIHQLFPFITVWDDHETANDAWKGGAQNHTPGTEGNYADRKRFSTSTYFKWMPIRKPDPIDTIRIFRKLRYGKLLDLIMLDTRLYDRDEQNLSATDDSSHHLMGPVELAWFLQQLGDTSTRWKIVGNQVMFAPLQVFGQPVNADQWDGYNYERNIIQNYILNKPVKNFVVLTGDIHTSWCNDIPGANYDDNTGAGSIGVEFVGASVTSLNSPLPVGASIIRGLNPHMKYINLDDHGYYVMDVRKGRAQADYTYVSTVTSPTATDIPGVHYYVNDNERHLRESNGYVSAPAITAPVPSLLPNQHLPFRRIEDHVVVTPENTAATVNVIPNGPVCPSVNINIGAPQHGLALSLNGQDVTYQPLNNYNGYDTVAITVCTNEAIPVCDTVYLYITVLSVQDIDTTTVELARDSTGAGCIVFDDITTYTGGINYTQPLNGTITLTDTCFTYTPDSGFIGFETITFTACDSSSNCDTVVFVFEVDHPSANQYINILVNKNSNYTYCLLFDDLSTEPVSVTVTDAPNHATFQWIGGDSCIKYFPYYNYTGGDTMQIVGCDNGVIPHCDTITLIFTVTEPSAITEPANLVVFGLYPNPVNDKLIVQYYLYEAEPVTMNVYDVSGKLVSTGVISTGSNGLHHAQLNAWELMAGNYVVELKTPTFSYRKQIIKQ
jgi:alkaline phosphatase D